MFKTSTASQSSFVAGDSISVCGVRLVLFHKGQQTSAFIAARRWETMVTSERLLCICLVSAGGNRKRDSERKEANFWRNPNANCTFCTELPNGHRKYHDNCQQSLPEKREEGEGMMAMLCYIIIMQWSQKLSIPYGIPMIVINMRMLTRRYMRETHQPKRNT